MRLKSLIRGRVGFRQRKITASIHKAILIPLLLDRCVAMYKHIEGRLINNAIKFHPALDKYYKSSFLVRSCCDTPPVEIGYNIARRVGKRDVFIDVGAYDGFISLLASKAAKEGTVYAIEPNPAILPLLKKNIRLNRMRNIIPLQVAVYSTNCRRRFYSNTNFQLASTLYEKLYYDDPHEATDIDCYSMDHYLLDIIKVSRVDFVNISLGGGEWHILNGMRQIIERFHPKLRYCIGAYSLITDGSNPQEVINFFSNYKYSPTLVDRFTGVETKTTWKKLLLSYHDFKAIRDPFTYQFPNWADLLIE